MLHFLNSRKEDLKEVGYELNVDDCPYNYCCEQSFALLRLCNQSDLMSICDWFSSAFSTVILISQRRCNILLYCHFCLGRNLGSWKTHLTQVKVKVKIM